MKTNVGHLDAAAGVAGLIKTVLALEHRQMPPTLHFGTPNPRSISPARPFFCQRRRSRTGPKRRRRAAPASAPSASAAPTRMSCWRRRRRRRRAERSRSCAICWCSRRKTSTALTATCADCCDTSANPESQLADVAHTLSAGAQRFTHRAGPGADGDEATPSAARARIATGAAAGFTAAATGRWCSCSPGRDPSM